MVKIFIYYLVFINLLTFILYAFDKAKAVYSWWRIKEKTLILMSGLGGCFGGLLAMYLFNHKIRQSKFVVINWLSCIIYIVVMIWIWS